MSVNVLDEISPEGTQKLLKMKRVDGCRVLNEKEVKDKGKLILSVRDSRFKHFSVYNDHVHYYIEFERVVVSYSRIE